MEDAALPIFNSLSKWDDLERLISNGEAEGIIECKAPQVPQLNIDLRRLLSKALSGFSNTEGGVYIWGLSTTKKNKTGLDIITSLEPLGNCKNFSLETQRGVRTLSNPPILNAKVKTIIEPGQKDRGVVIAYIPKTTGDPIQANDNVFYFRNNDEFIALPYQMLQRLFAATESPDLQPQFDSRIVKLEPSGVWVVPIAINNRSSAVAEHVTISVEIENFSACGTASIKRFTDQSGINPGAHIFMQEVEGVIHRGLNVNVGELQVEMKKAKRVKRVLKLKIAIYANKMRAHVWKVSIQLAKKKFSVKVLSDEHLY